jgi:hypothetical protein
MRHAFTIIELFAVAAFGVLASLGISIIVLLMIWTDRTLDFWATHFAGHPVNCPWWMSAMATIALNGVIVLVNVASELIRLCM